METRSEATQRQRQGQTFSGVMYAHQLRVPIGDCVRDLEIIVQAGEPEDMVGQSLFEAVIEGVNCFINLR